MLSSLPDSPRCKVPSDFCLNLAFGNLLRSVAGTALMKVNLFQKINSKSDVVVDACSLHTGHMQGWWGDRLSMGHLIFGPC